MVARGEGAKGWVEKDKGTKRLKKPFSVIRIKQKGREVQYDSEKVLGRIEVERCYVKWS